MDDTPGLLVFWFISLCTLVFWFDTFTDVEIIGNLLFLVAFFLSIILSIGYYHAEFWIFKLKPKNMKRHTKQINAIALSAKGLITSGKDRKTLIWEFGNRDAIEGIVTRQKFRRLHTFEEFVVASTTKQYLLELNPSLKLYEGDRILYSYYDEFLFSSKFENYLLIGGYDDPHVYVYKMDTIDLVANYEIPYNALLGIGSNSTNILILRLLPEGEDSLVLDIFEIVEDRRFEKVTSYYIDALKHKVMTYKMDPTELSGSLDDLEIQAKQMNYEIEDTVLEYQMVCNDYYAVLHSFREGKELLIWNIVNGESKLVELDWEIKEISSAYLENEYLYIGIERNGLFFLIIIRLSGDFEIEIIYEKRFYSKITALRPVENSLYLGCKDGELIRIDLDTELKLTKNLI